MLALRNTSSMFPPTGMCFSSNTQVEVTSEIPSDYTMGWC